MVNFILTIVSSDLSLDLRLVFTVKTIVITLDALAHSELVDLLDEVIGCDLTLLLSWHLEHLDISDQISDILALILLQDSDGVIDFFIFHEGTLDFFDKVMSNGSSHSNPDIRYSVINQHQEVILEIFLEQLLAHHHLAMAHEGELLSLLEGGRFDVPLLDNSHDSLLLGLAIVKFLENITQCGAAGDTHLGKIVRAELEKHWNELLVNSFSIEQLSVVS